MSSDRAQILNSRRGDQLNALEVGPTWGDCVATRQGLPGTRGVWTMGSYDNNLAVYDISGQARTLTNNGTITANAVSLAGGPAYAPYMSYDGSTGFHSRASEAALQVAGALTWGGWFSTSVVPPANFKGLIGKWNDNGVNQRSYLLLLHTNGNVQAYVSGDGIATPTIGSGVTLSANVWHHIFARYTPSTELALFIDGAKVTNTTSIPAALFASNAALIVAGYNAGLASTLLNGSASLLSLHAAALTDQTLFNLYQQERLFFGA